MSRLWFTGLEAGSLEVFPRVDSTAAISAAQARTGTYSLHIPTTGDRAFTALGGGYAELFLRIGLYMTGGYSAVDRTFCTLLDVEGSELLHFQVRNADNVLLVRRGDYNDTLIATGGIVPTNTWCCIEIRALIDNAAGIVQVKIGGTQVVNFAGDTQDGSMTEICAVCWGASAEFVNSVCYGYYDDLAVNDPSGSRNNTWLGQGGVVGLFPTGVGSYAQLTPTAGGNWECVNEAPPDDNVSYVEDAVVDQRDAYEMQDLVIAPKAVADIAAVQWICRGLNTETLSGNFARLLRMSGTDYQGGDIGYDRPYGYRMEIMETSPATGGDWSEAEVNDLEAGMVVR